MISNKEEKIKIQNKVVKYYVDHGIKTNRDLHRFIECLTRESMPFESVCSDHYSPFHYLSFSYFEKYRKMIVIGPREGGKTKTIAKLNATQLITKPNIGIAIVGAVEGQSKRCYRYTKNYLENDVIRPLLAKPPIQKETIMRNGATYEQLVGTVNGVNSPHPNKLIADEVELMSREVIEEMLMVPVTTKGVAEAGISLISSRKYSSGNMQEWSDKAKEKNYKCVTWCYKEITERCPDEKSGVKNRDYEIEDISDPTKKRIMVKAKEECINCLLLPTCRGDLKRSNGFKSIQDLEDEFLDCDIETFLAQQECRKPVIKGKTYYEFEKNIHVIENIKPDGLWPIWRTWDFGFTNPTVCLWITYNKIKDIYIVFYEHFRSNRMIEDHAKEVHSISSRYGPTIEDFGDPAAAQERWEFSKEGIMITPGYNNISFGEKEIKKLLRISPVTRKPKLFICKRCVNLIREMNNLKKRKVRGEFIELNIEIDDHATDALRYFFATQARRLVSKSRPNASIRPSRKRNNEMLQSL